MSDTEVRKTFSGQPFPEVSIIVAAYNCAPYIKEAIDSVTAQSFSNFEIIAVNDGSTDETGAILQGLATNDQRIRIVTQKNSGTAAGARNAGLKIAKGCYICFLDGDDTFHHEKLAEEIRVFNDNPDIGLVFHDIQLISQIGTPLPGTYLGNCNYLSRAREVLTSNDGRVFRSTSKFYSFMTTEITGMSTLSVMIKRSALESEIEMFYVEQPVGEDIDLWFRLAAKYKVGYINIVLGYYRQHSESVTRNGEKLSKGFIFAHSRNFERAKCRLSSAQVKRCKEKIASEWFNLAYLQRRNGEWFKSIISFGKSLLYSFRFKTIFAISKTVLFGIIK